MDPSGHCLTKDGVIRFWKWPIGWTKFCPEDATTSENQFLPTPVSNSRKVFSPTATLLAGYTEADLLGLHQKQITGSDCFPTSLAMALNLLDPYSNFEQTQIDAILRYNVQQSKNIGMPTIIQEDAVNSVLTYLALDGEFAAELHTYSDYISLRENVDQGVVTIVTVSWGTSRGISDTQETIDNNVGHSLLLIGYDTMTDEIHFLDPIRAPLVNPSTPDEAGIWSPLDGEFSRYWLHQPNIAIKAGTAITIKRR